VSDLGSFGLKLTDLATL